MAISQPAASPTSADGGFRRNLAIMFVCLAVLGSQTPMLVIIGGLAGRELLDTNKMLATLPITAMMMGSWLLAMPMSLFMGRFGRRAGFLTGTFFGMMAGLLGAIAVTRDEFWLLVAAAGCMGIYLSSQNYFRFAAADIAPPALRPKAISWIMGAGLISALLGPELIQQTGPLFPENGFVGVFLAMIAVNMIGSVIVSFIDIPKPPPKPDRAHGGRSLMEILCRRQVATAIIVAMVSFSLMTLVMTATPLVMDDHGFSKHRIADVVRWHVFSMYAPSFVTGNLIARFGHRRVIAVGLVLLGLSGLTGYLGESLTHFYLCMVLLGLGWNFGYVGGTSLLTENHRPEERAQVQGFNDFSVFGLVTFASLASGALIHLGGWHSVLLAMVPALAVATLILIWGLRRGGADKSPSP